MVQTRATGRPFPGWGTSDNKIAAIWIALAMVTSLTIGGVIGLSNVDSWLYINSSTWVNGSMNISEDLFVNGTLTAGNVNITNLTVENMNFTNLTITGDIFNISADETYVNALFPNAYCTSDLGSDALRWRNIYVCGNVTSGYFYGDGSHLTNLPAGTEVDPLWTGNVSIFNSSWLSTTNSSYLEIINWNATNTSYALESMLNNGSYFNYPWNATNTSYLEIKNWNATNTSYLEIKNWNATNTSYLEIKNWNATNTSYLEIKNWNATNSSYMLNAGDTVTGNYRFWDGFVETFYINSTSNKVGIGTISPDGLLHVYAGDSGGTAHAFSSITAEDDANAMISTLTANTSTGYFGFGDNDDTFVGGFAYAHELNRLSVHVNDAVKMTILSDGKVGIGTTSPIDKLEVANTNATGYLWNIVSRNLGHSADAEKGAGIKFKFSSSDAGTEANKWAGITGVSELAWETRVGLAFYTVFNYDVAAPTEKMRISGNGNVGIGTASPQNPLNVVGAINSTTGFIVGASVGYSGFCINMTYVGGIAVTCND